jgi:hypothetical protein
MLITTTGSLAQAADDSEEIKKLCMAGFNTAMSQARQTPPEGMAEFTCACFAREMKSIAFILQAQTICKELAAEKYGPFLKTQ